MSVDVIEGIGSELNSYLITGRYEIRMLNLLQYQSIANGSISGNEQHWSAKSYILLLSYIKKKKYCMVHIILCRFTCGAQHSQPLQTHLAHNFKP